MTTNGETNKQATAQVITAQPGANVKLAHGKQPITVDGVVNIGTHTVEMPSEAQQRAGFKSDKAHLLIQQYPAIYLPIVAKGGQ